MITSDLYNRKDSQTGSLPTLKSSKAKVEKPISTFFEAIEFYKKNLNRLKISQKKPQARPINPIPTKKTVNFIKLTFNVSPPCTSKNQLVTSSSVTNKIAYSKVKSVNSIKINDLNKGITANKINIQANPRTSGQHTARLFRSGCSKTKIKPDQVSLDKKSIRKNIIVSKEVYVDASSESSFDMKLEPVFQN